jgi:Ser/Thr protein kinase RdoA (MazF antagonist)
LSSRERQRFAADELAVVLSHYDLGVIESITEFNRGSRQSPKVGIVAQRGKFLLKKRAERKKSPRRIAFSHAVQLHLAASDFPLPKLQSSREGHTALTLSGEVYELFAYISGNEFESTVPQARNAGATLALFHKSLADFPIDDDPPSGTYHDVIGVRTALNAVPASVSSHDSAVGREAEILPLINLIFQEYDEASERVDALGLPDFPTGVIHADWHPGNMLFRRDEIVAAVDFDSCRVAQPITDVANGALQFSMTTGGHPDDWPDNVDEERFAAFLAGYQERSKLSDANLACIPSLMIEALIAEAVLPIANTGSFGRLPGLGFLRTVGRKAKWLRRNEERLTPLRESR